MNKFRLLPLFLLMFINAKAQDKIIGIHQDTIHCTILSISNERIFYEQKNNDGSVTGKFIPLSQVSEYSSTHQPTKRSEMKKLCLGLNVGRSTMPWYFDDYQSSSAMPDFYNKLKTGFHVGANAHYMIKESWGLGLEYSFFKTSTSGRIPGGYYSTIFFMESEEYRQYINYVGPSLLFQQHLDRQRKFTLSESLSAGVLLVRMEYQSTYPSVNQLSYTDVSSNMLLTGSTFSGKFGLSAEYRLFKSVSVGLGSNFIWGLLKRADFESKGSNNYSNSANNQKLTNAMKVSRIDYSFVLHYNF